MTGSNLSFPDSIDRKITTSKGEAVFGRDVLATLIEELDEASRRRRTDRNWGPGVLGCAMWMDDPDLIDVLHRMANACVVVTKQPTKRYAKPDLKPLTDLAAANGLAQAAYPELIDLAPHQCGQPSVVGPTDLSLANSREIGAVREVGFRKVDDHLVPIVHAKIMLLGRMGWTDEHPTGHVDDHLYFVPEKLWIGSANFTKRSRSSLEMGMWTAEPNLTMAARDWLLALVALSEPLGSGDDLIDPELLPVEYDDAAFAEYFREQP